MAQAISRRPLTAECRVRAWVNPRGICGGQSASFVSDFFEFALSRSLYRRSPLVDWYTGCCDGV
jgi:hypothetical protein